ncbi:MAG TPA: cytochrome b [Burkholderiales bacterium]|nr:cytochrome b [Burkholderiales bacterium]
MGRIANTESGYGDLSIAVHWAMAALLIALVILGLYMVQLPDAGFDTKKITLILYHKEIGIAALALAVFRLAWRVTNVLPRLVEALPEWQKVMARFVHLNFYAVMFALPISGWLMSSAAGFPVSFLELFDLPDLVPRNDYLFEVFVVIHKWLAYMLIGLFVVHAGAALRHHFVFGDDTLRKMLPGHSRRRVLNRFFPARTRRFPSAPSL